LLSIPLENRYPAVFRGPNDSPLKTAKLDIDGAESYIVNRGKNMRPRLWGKIEHLACFGSLLIAFIHCGMNSHAQEAEIAPKINVFVVDVIVLPINGYEKELVLAAVKKTLAEMNMKTTEIDAKDGPVLSLAGRTDWLFPSYSPSGSWSFCYAYGNNYYLVNQVTSNGKALEIILGKKDIGSSDVVGRKILLRFVDKLKSNLGE
jgi:hypothetical protein